MVTLDQETHVYTDDNGNVVPGVTSIIADLSNFDGIDPGVLERKAQLGRHVHAATELYDQGVLDWSTVHPKALPYVQAWCLFVYESGVEIIESEQIVYHRSYRFAGMLDRKVGWRDELNIIDIKCVAVVGPQTGIQLAGYSLAAYPDDSGTIKRRAIQLLPNGRYKVHKFDDRQDRSVFLSCLNIYNWRLKNGN